MKEFTFEICYDLRLNVVIKAESEEAANEILEAKEEEFPLEVKLSGPFTEERCEYIDSYVAYEKDL